MLKGSDKEAFSSLWSKDEIISGTKTKKLLLDGKETFDETLIDDRALWLTVVNCKFNPEKAAEKYRKWVHVMRDEFKLHFKDVFMSISSQRMMWKQDGRSFLHCLQRMQVVGVTIGQIYNVD